MLLGIYLYAPVLALSQGWYLYSCECGSVRLLACAYVCMRMRVSWCVCASLLYARERLCECIAYKAIIVIITVYHIIVVIPDTLLFYLLRLASM